MLNLFALSLRIFPDGRAGASSWELWGLGCVGAAQGTPPGTAPLEMQSRGEAEGWRLQQCLERGTLAVPALAVTGASPGVSVPLQVPAAPRTARLPPSSSARTTPAWCRGAARPPWSAWPTPGTGTPPQLSVGLSVLSREGWTILFSFFFVLLIWRWKRDACSSEQPYEWSCLSNTTGLNLLIFLAKWGSRQRCFPARSSHGKEKKCCSSSRHYLKEKIRVRVNNISAVAYQQQRWHCWTVDAPQ